MRQSSRPRGPDEQARKQAALPFRSGRGLLAQAALAADPIGRGLGQLLGMRFVAHGKHEHHEHRQNRAHAQKQALAVEHGREHDAQRRPDGHAERLAETKVADALPQPAGRKHVCRRRRGGGCHTAKPDSLQSTKRRLRRDAGQHERTGSAREHEGGTHDERAPAHAAVDHPADDDAGEPRAQRELQDEHAGKASGTLVVPHVDGRAVVERLAPDKGEQRDEKQDDEVGRPEPGLSGGHGATPPDPRE